ncbi:MAG: S-layer homology domain-containing protein [Thermicanus sp.]|nr:S-layer homology domain-containing protein [Thermicanus sp.]
MIIERSKKRGLKRTYTFFLALCLLLSPLLPSLSSAAGESGMKEPKVRIALSGHRLEVGDLLEVGIWLQGWSGPFGGVQGYQLKLSYDPLFLQPVPDGEEGKFEHPSIFPPSASPITFVNRIGRDGTIEIAQAVEGYDHLFYGYGKIGTLTFRALKEGTTRLTPEKSILILPGNPGINIRHTANEATITIGKKAAGEEKILTVGDPVKAPLPLAGKEELLGRFLDKEDLYRLSWAVGAVYDLAAKRILVGMPDGRFYPNRPMTRAEFAKIAVQAFRLDMMQVRTPSFPDVSKKDWFYDDVETARIHGLIKGKPVNGGLRFAPQDPITRAEIAAILARGETLLRKKELPPATDLPFLDIDASLWAKNEISSLYRAGILKGRSPDHFAPMEEATRAEISTLIYRLLQRDK